MLILSRLLSLLPLSLYIASCFDVSTCQHCSSNNNAAFLTRQLANKPEAAIPPKSYGWRKIRIFSILRREDNSFTVTPPPPVNSTFPTSQAESPSKIETGVETDVQPTTFATALPPATTPPPDFTTIVVGTSPTIVSTGVEAPTVNPFPSGESVTITLPITLPSVTDVPGTINPSLEPSTVLDTLVIPSLPATEVTPTEQRTDQPTATETDTTEESRSPVTDVSHATETIPNTEVISPIISMSGTVAVTVTPTEILPGSKTGLVTKTKGVTGTPTTPHHTTSASPTKSKKPTHKGGTTPLATNARIVVPVLCLSTITMAFGCCTWIAIPPRNRSNNIRLMTNQESREDLLPSPTLQSNYSNENFESGDHSGIPPNEFEQIALSPLMSEEVMTTL